MGLVIYRVSVLGIDRNLNITMIEDVIAKLWYFMILLERSNMPP